MTRFLPFAAVFALIGLTADATSQPPSAKSSTRPRPKLEAVAETKLLMEALLMTNHRGLARNLSQEKPEAQALVFSRGQALVIAESGNLLMLRPPKSGGTDEWMELASELRDRGTKLAKAIADKDLNRSRQGFSDLTATCNRCHQTFRVPVRVPLGEKE
ncbi:MAG: cytochrome c [Gemmataceae bacterium]